MNSNTEKQAQTELNNGSLRLQTDLSLAPAAEGGRGAGERRRDLRCCKCKCAETRQWTDEGRALRGAAAPEAHTRPSQGSTNCHKGVATQRSQLIPLIRSCVQIPNIEYYPFIIGNYHKHFQNTFRAKQNMSANQIWNTDCQSAIADLRREPRKSHQST